MEAVILRDEQKSVRFRQQSALMMHKHQQVVKLDHSQKIATENPAATKMKSDLMAGKRTKDEISLNN